MTTVFHTWPYGTNNETFHQSGKKRLFQTHIEDFSCSMYESSGSQFLRTTTGIQSGPDAIDESGFVMTFLTILGVMEILCSFRLVLNRKQVRRYHSHIKIRFLEKFLANNFALSDAEGNTSGIFIFLFFFEFVVISVAATSSDFFWRELFLF